MLKTHPNDAVHIMVNPRRHLSHLTKPADPCPSWGSPVLEFCRQASQTNQAPSPFPSSTKGHNQQNAWGEGARIACLSISLPFNGVELLLSAGRAALPWPSCQLAPPRRSGSDLQQQLWLSGPLVARLLATCNAHLLTRYLAAGPAQGGAARKLEAATQQPHAHA